MRSFLDLWGQVWHNADMFPPQTQPNYLVVLPSWKAKDSESGRDQIEADIKDDTRETEGAEQNILCSACKSLVTTAEQKISVAGKHSHVQTNPEGIVFHLGCFSAAPGCAAIGEEYSYWSWFKGYTWQVALCRVCSWHLGWLFRSGERSFYGLILGRLTEEQEQSQRQ